MENFFEKPEQGDAPVGESRQAPWSIEVGYKSGKIPEAFADSATPEKVKAGFSYYDKSDKKTVPIGTLDAIIVQIAFGASGTVQDGDKYVNYTSNLVLDTRSQVLEVFTFVKSGDAWKKYVVATGFYADIKSGLPKGVGFSKHLICLIPQTNELICINLSAQLEAALKDAIAESLAMSVQKISIFDIAKRADKFWAFSFDGKFNRRTKDGFAWNGKGEMYYAPSLSAGVVSDERFPALNDVRGQIEAYIDAAESAVWKSEKPAQQEQSVNPGPLPIDIPSHQRFAPIRTAPSSDDFFPTEEPKAPVDTEDLPF